MFAFTRFIALAVFSIIAGTASAQEYPNKSILFVVPFGPGQSADVASRIIAQRLSQALGQPIVVENKPGAGGMIAANFVAKARPDGYTLLVGSSATHGMNAALFANLSYDPIKDFVPVAYFGSTSIVLSTAPGFAATSTQELIRLAKEKPGAFHVATANPGASSVLALLQQMASIKLTEVQYKTNASAFVDVIGDRVPLIIDSIAGSLPQINGGRVKPLGLSGSARSRILPNVPTLAEAGMPGFDLSPWNVLFAPRGTPAPVVSRLNAALAKVLVMPEVVELLSKAGYDTSSHRNPAELIEFVGNESRKWGDLVRKAGVVPQ